MQSFNQQSQFRQSLLFFVFIALFHQITSFVPKLRHPHNALLRPTFMFKAKQPAPAAFNVENAQNLFSSNIIQTALAKWLIDKPLIGKMVSAIPPPIRDMTSILKPGDLLFFIFFKFTYKKVLRFAHRTQVLVWKLLSLGEPYEWNQSILGFVRQRSSLLTKLLGCNYVANVIITLLGMIGFNIRSEFPQLISRISYTLYFANFIDLFKTKYLTTFFPGIGENRRQNYVVNRSMSVALWIISILIVCEMISTFLKIPLSSTLAFGGVGGLAIGLSARDVAANLLGGMMLLFNEPFTPGDMVTFRTGNAELIGRVERVGWGQTRIRGRDTRPTYIPNSHFVSTAVTNMERITHRKFETIVPIRFQDYTAIVPVINRIKDRLRTIAKLDVLSMPFRVSFLGIGEYSLQIEITCYFATKSIDEFLVLQQAANIEIVSAIQDCGASLALPTTQLRMDAADQDSLARKLRSALVDNTGVASVMKEQTTSVPVVEQSLNKQQFTMSPSSAATPKANFAAGVTRLDPQTEREYYADTALQTADRDEPDNEIGLVDNSIGEQLWKQKNSPMQPPSQPQVEQLERQTDDERLLALEKQRFLKLMNVSIDLSLEGQLRNKNSSAYYIDSIPVSVVDDNLYAGAPLQDSAWEQSVYSAGIATDGRKYFDDTSNQGQQVFSPTAAPVADSAMSLDEAEREAQFAAKQQFYSSDDPADEELSSAQSEFIDRPMVFEQYEAVENDAFIGTSRQVDVKLGDDLRQAYQEQGELALGEEKSDNTSITQQESIVVADTDDAEYRRRTALIALDAMRECDVEDDDLSEKQQQQRQRSQYEVISARNSTSSDNLENDASADRRKSDDAGETINDE